MKWHDLQVKISWKIINGIIEAGERAWSEAIWRTDSVNGRTIEENGLDGEVEKWRRELALTTDRVWFFAVRAAEVVASSHVVAADSMDEQTSGVQRQEEVERLLQALARTLENVHRGLPRPGSYHPARTCARMVRNILARPKEWRVEQAVDGLAQAWQSPGGPWNPVDSSLAYGTNLVNVSEAVSVRYSDVEAVSERPSTTLSSEGGVSSRTDVGQNTSGIYHNGYNLLGGEAHW